MNQSIHRRVRFFFAQCKPHHYLAIANIFFSCLLLGLIINHSYRQQHILFDDYGDSLSHLMADQLAVVMSNHNLIGLQSLLKEMTQYKDISNATVYDVDNTIIVQAGNLSNQGRDNNKIITSAITLDNALLGSLTVTVNNRVNLPISLITLLLISTLLPTILLFFKTPIVALANRDHLHIKPEVKSPPSKTSAPGQSVLVLHIHTLDKLFQQLNAEARQQQFLQFQDRLKKLLTLYSGDYLSASRDGLIIGFNNTEALSRLFNALCCAQLLQETNERQSSLLQFSAIVYEANRCLDLSEGLLPFRQLLNSTANQSGLFINNISLECAGLRERLQLQPLQGSNFTKVTGFSGNHRALLENQLTHLLQTKA